MTSVLTPVHLDTSTRVCPKKTSAHLVKSLQTVLHLTTGHWKILEGCREPTFTLLAFIAASPLPNGDTGRVGTIGVVSADQVSRDSNTQRILPGAPRELFELWASPVSPALRSFTSYITSKSPLPIVPYVAGFE